MIRHALGVLGLVLFVSLGADAAATAEMTTQSVSSLQTTKKVDLDQDGFQETELIYEGKLIVKALIDENGDGKIDGTILYRNGARDSGERDVNFDGQTDTWIRYYITGLPWEITRDKNGDGKVDYWKYLKNGFVYKREWDRNFDGKPDVRILVPGKADLRGVDEPKQKIEKQYDDDFDGQFEKVEKVTKRVPQIRASMAAGAVDEV